MRATGNNFGVLRLVLASLVIVGHAPEQIDGNRSREPLTLVFHTISLGGLAVAGFFLLSGFLIAKSAMTTPSIWRYLENRVRRIVPGFVAAFLLCVFVLAPLVGGHPWKHLGSIAERLVVLGIPPQIPGALSGLPYPDLDGSMWTIAYEFRCYLLIAALFGLGLLKRRGLVVGLTAAVLAGSVALSVVDPKGALDAATTKVWALVGAPSNTLQLTGTFLVGTCVYLFWPELKDRLTAWAALAASLLLAIGLFSPLAAPVALAIFGGVVLFWLALKADFGPFQRVNDRWDISYGVYLYGWPVAITLLYFDRQIGPLALALTALPVSMALGAASWWGLERWVKTPATSAAGKNGQSVRQAAAGRA